MNHITTAFTCSSTSVCSHFFFPRWNENRGVAGNMIQNHLYICILFSIKKSKRIRWEFDDDVFTCWDKCNHIKCCHNALYIKWIQCNLNFIQQITLELYIMLFCIYHKMEKQRWKWNDDGRFFAKDEFLRAFNFFLFCISFL